MLRYWAATAFFYLVLAGLLQLQINAGTASTDAAKALIRFGLGGVLLFYGLLRLSVVLRIAHSHLAVLQALFSIVCTCATYAVTGPFRGAALMNLLVTIVFCMFSLRPRATLMLCASALAMLGATMYWLVLRDPLMHPPQIEAMHFALATCSLVAVSVLTGTMSKLRSGLKHQKEELLAAVGTIRTLATIDELTLLANRRYMNEVLNAEERRESGIDLPICIALLDIDYFKRINDRYGHGGGDAVLRTFAAAARTELRAADVLARWGGEEFLMLLPDTSLAEAQLVLQRMAERVGAIHVSGLDVELKVTFSGGVVQRIEGEPFSHTIQRADKAMYQAKSDGRNRVLAGLISPTGA